MLTRIFGITSIDLLKDIKHVAFLVSEIVTGCFLLSPTILWLSYIINEIDLKTLNTNPSYRTEPLLYKLYYSRTADMFEKVGCE